MSAILHGLTFPEYRSLDGLSITTLKNLGRSPLHYAHALKNPKESAAMSLGTAAHTAVLEPHKLMTDYALWGGKTESGRAKPRTGKDWEAFKAENASKKIITLDDFELAQGMRDAVRGYGPAMKYLETGEAEVSMQWEDQDTGRACRGRIDWLTRIGGVDVLVGLKTARDGRHFQFAKQAANLGYHLQWAYYSDGFQAITGHAPKMVEIVVENTAPFEPFVYVIQEDVLDQGRTEYQRLFGILADCEAGRSYPPLMSEEQVLSLPSWVYGVDDSDSDLSDIGISA